MSERWTRWRRLAPLAVVVLLGAATFVDDGGWLQLRSADTTVADDLAAALDALPDRPLVLVGFDPDVGTYAEVRPTVRALVADLLQREARLAFVSLTPEGRALAVAELERLARAGANPRRLLDLGFVPGAEAAIVRLARAPIETDAGGAIADRLAADGAAAIDAAVVIGGNDLGPRAWVEQFAPRVDVPIVAVAPTVLLPELLPYRDGGQLDALIATPRDGAAYRASLDLERLSRFADEPGPSPFAVLVGLLVALAALVPALAGRVMAAAREARAREPS
jgi:hypothetical protein